MKVSYFKLRHVFDLCFPTMLLHGDLICDSNVRVSRSLSNEQILSGNDSWCFAMREVYKWSRIHKPSPPTVCKHLRSAIIPSQGHWGSPIHGLLAVLHVLNPSSGSDVWGNVNTLRGCLAYGLLAAEATKLLAEPPLLLEVWMLTWNQVSWKIQKNRWFSGVYVYIYIYLLYIYEYV